MQQLVSFLAGLYQPLGRFNR